MTDDPLAPESLDPNDVIAKPAGLAGHVAAIVAELARVRAERDRLAAFAFAVSSRPVEEREDWLIRRLADGSLPGGNLAAALAEHDKQANERSQS